LIATRRKLRWQCVIGSHRAHDRSDALEDQLNDGAFKAADVALRTIVAINGGAIVGMLALIGAVVGHGKADAAQVTQLVSYLSRFIYGVVAGCLDGWNFLRLFYCNILVHRARKNL